MSLAILLKRKVREHPGILSTDGTILKCDLCNKLIKYDTSHGSTTLKTHLESKKHILNLSKPSDRSKQPFLLKSINGMKNDKQRKEEFNQELCNAWVGANIPLVKLNNVGIKNFLTKWAKFNIPDESTLRTGYVVKECDRIRKEIIEDVIDKDICLIVDEATANNKKILHILVGKLDGHDFKPKLFEVRILEATDSLTVTHAIIETITSLYPDGVRYDKVRLILSDQAPYVTCAGKKLKEFYPNLIRVTCVVHAFQIVCLKLKELNRVANSFQSSFQSLFDRASHRMAEYKTSTRLPLTPDVIVTRWASWLKGIVYIATNYEKIRTYIEELPSNKNDAVINLQALIGTQNSEDGLFNVFKEGFLIDAINEMETRSLTLERQVQIIRDVTDKLSG